MRVIYPIGSRIENGVAVPVERPTFVENNGSALQATDDMPKGLLGAENLDDAITGNREEYSLYYKLINANLIVVLHVFQGFDSCFLWQIC